MQNTSATWKSLLASPDVLLETKAIIGETDYTQMSSPVITRALTQQGLSIGNVVSATCQFSILTDDTIPRASEVQIKQRLTDGTTASEWLPVGTFYISRRTRDAVTGLLTLECYDALLKANALMPAGAYPQSMQNVVNALAQVLGVTIDSRTTIKTGAAYVINQPDAGTTIQEVLSIIAAANGGNWIITPAGQLRLVPIVSATGAAAATTDVIDVTGIVGDITAQAANEVTGIRYQTDGNPVILGDDTGIVVDANVGAAIANDLYDDLHGLVYQAYNLNGAIYDPAAELGDYVRGGANAEVQSVLYSETATLGMAFRSNIAAPEADELSDEYPYIGGNEKVLMAAKLYAAQQVESLDESLTQQEVFNRLTGNGAAQGLYIVDGQLYVNATYIQSGTLRLGGINNENGLLEILDDTGEVAIRGDNTGIAVGAGKITVGGELGHYSDPKQITLIDGRLVFSTNNGNTFGELTYSSGANPILSLDAGLTGSGIRIIGNRYRIIKYDIETYERPVIRLYNGAVEIGFNHLALVAQGDESSVSLQGNAASSLRKALNTNYKTYTSVADLYQTVGSATILDTYDAMGTNAILICPIADFASSEAPTIDGTTVTQATVEIVRANVAGRGYIHCYRKTAGTYDWRMYLNSDNSPTGTWVRTDDHALSLATDSGTNQLTLAANRKYKLTVGAKTLIFTMPSSLQQQHPNLSKGTNPSTTQYYMGNFWTDINGTATGNRLGGIEGNVNSSGDCKMYMRAYKYTSGSGVYNDFAIGIKADGTNFYSVSAPAAFCTAIGIDSGDITTISDYDAAGRGFAYANVASSDNPNGYPSYGGLLTLSNTIKTRIAQLFISATSDGYIRVRRYNETWRDWCTVYTSKNTIPIANGGTGATTAAAARTALEITPANIGAMSNGGGDFNSSAGITFQSPNIDADNATVVNKSGSHINYYDKDKYIYGVLRGTQDANGNPGLALVARRPVSGTDYVRYFSISVDSSGEAVYRVDNPANFRAAINTKNTQYTIYSSVSELGLTVGSATILAAYNKMKTDGLAILICNAGDFASSEVPNTYGTVEIAVYTAGREYVNFYGKAGSNNDWRMFCGSTSYNGNDGNAPSGTWVCLSDRRMTKDFSYTATAAMTIGRRVAVVQQALPSGITADKVKSVYLSAFDGSGNFYAMLTLANSTLYISIYAASTSSTASCSGTATVVY